MCPISSELLQKRRILFFQNFKEFQTRRDNSRLSGMITDQLKFYNVDNSSSSCFYVYNGIATLKIRDK